MSAEIETLKRKIADLTIERLDQQYACAEMREEIDRLKSENKRLEDALGQQGKIEIAEGQNE